MKPEFRVKKFVLSRAVDRDAGVQPGSTRDGVDLLVLMQLMPSNTTARDPCWPFNKYPTFFLRAGERTWCTRCSVIARTCFRARVRSSSEHDGMPGKFVPQCTPVQEDEYAMTRYRFDDGEGVRDAFAEAFERAAERAREWKK